MTGAVVRSGEFAFLCDKYMSSLLENFVKICDVKLADSGRTNIVESPYLSMINTNMIAFENNPYQLCFTLQLEVNLQ